MSSKEAELEEMASKPQFVYSVVRIIPARMNSVKALLFYENMQFQRLVVDR